MEHTQDPYGFTTLDILAEADNFNEWTFDSIKEYCSGSILEIGSGIGNISTFFVRNGYSITLSDFQQSYCSELKGKFGNLPNVHGILSIDLVHPEFDKQYNHLLGSFDTLFTLNVVEHIEDDNQAVSNCKKLLKKGGTFIILVPAYQWLYNGFDVQLAHFRRYNSLRLVSLLRINGFKIKRSWYFNLIGTIGWFINGSMLKKKQLPEGQLRIFNFLTPLFKFADKVTFRKAGLSVIAVGIND